MGTDKNIKLHIVTDIKKKSKMRSKINSVLTKVFIYGTLKQGFPNHHHLQDFSHGMSKFICLAKTVKKYPLLVDKDRWYIPFLLDTDGMGHHVQGEVYEVDQVMLDWLDQFEAVGDLYKVVQLDVMNEHEQTLTCLCYMMNDSNDKYLQHKYQEIYTIEDAALYCEP